MVFFAIWEMVTEDYHVTEYSPPIQSKSTESDGTFAIDPEAAVERAFAFKDQRLTSKRGIFHGHKSGQGSAFGS